MSDLPFEYENMPSLEDLKQAGATEWASGALTEKLKQDAALLLNLAPESEELLRQDEDLLTQLVLEDGQSKAKGPDLFASEKKKVAKERAAQSQLAADLKESRKADEEMLRNLFG